MTIWRSFCKFMFWPGYRMGKSSANPSWSRGRVLHISSNVRCYASPIL